MKIRSK